MILSEDRFELLLLLLLVLQSPAELPLLLVFRLLEVGADVFSRGPAILAADEAPGDDNDNFEVDDVTTAEDDDDVEVDDEAVAAFVMSFKESDGGFVDNEMDGAD